MFYKVTKNGTAFYFKRESKMWAFIQTLDFLNDPVSFTIETCIFEEPKVDYNAT